MFRALAALWLFAAAPAPAPDSREAVCSLRALFTSQKSYFQEKDRYAETPAQAGFVPDECPDGTLPLSPHPVHARSCHFIYRFPLPEPHAKDFRAEALGVRGPWQGVRFELREDGRVLRADGSEVKETCETPAPEFAPLVRYFETVTERDCIAPPAPHHPCDAALRDMVRLANGGMGLAQRLYATRPFARALGMREPSAPYISLCAADNRAQSERDLAAVVLEKRRQLAEVVLSRHCAAAGIRTGLRRLLAPGTTPCPGVTCLPLLALARAHPGYPQGLPENVDAAKATQGYKALLQANAEAVTAALMALGADERATAFSAVLGHPTRAAAALAGLLEGAPIDAGALPLPESDPITAKLLEAGRKTPGGALSLRASRELSQDGGLSDPTFEALLAGDCAALERALPPRLKVAQLQRLSREAGRCPDVYLSRLEPDAARVPAGDLPGLLAPLGTEQRMLLRDKLGLMEPARAEALIGWVVEHAPELLPALRITKPVAQQLLRPERYHRLGGKEAMLEAVAGVAVESSWKISPDAYALLAEEAPWPLPTRPPRVPPGPPPGLEPARTGDFGLLHVVDAQGKRDLFVQSPGSSVERRLTTSGRVARSRTEGARVALSPDRRWVAYAEQAPPARDAPFILGWNSLHVVRTDGKAHRQLVALEAPPPGASRQEAGALVWSDDGTRLAFALHTAAGPGIADACPDTELFEVQVATGAMRRLSHERLRGRVRLLRWRSVKPELVLDEECGTGSEAWQPHVPHSAAWLDVTTGKVQRRLSRGRLHLSPDGAEAFLGNIRFGTHPGVYEDAGRAAEPRLPLGLPYLHDAGLLWFHRSPSALVVMQPSPRVERECAGSQVPEPTLARLDLLTGTSRVAWRQRSGVRVLSLSPDDGWALVGLLTGDTRDAFMCGPIRLERLYVVRIQDLERTASLRELRERATPVTPLSPRGTEGGNHLGWVRR
jgi:hypothetical protein